MHLLGKIRTDANFTIKMRYFSQEGSPLTDTLPISTLSTSQTQVSLASFGNSVSAAWVNGAEITDIRANIFDLTTGKALAVEMATTPFSGVNQATPQIVPDGEGNYWISYQRSTQTYGSIAVVRFEVSAAETTLETSIEFHATTTVSATTTSPLISSTTTQPSTTLLVPSTTSGLSTTSLVPSTTVRPSTSSLVPSTTVWPSTSSLVPSTTSGLSTTSLLSSTSARTEYNLAAVINNYATEYKLAGAINNCATEYKLSFVDAEANNQTYNCDSRTGNIKQHYG